MIFFVLDDYFLYSNPFLIYCKTFLIRTILIFLFTDNKNPVEARTEIVGPPIRYLTPGSTLKLICRIVQNTEASAFIFWYHDNRMINYDVDRGINVSTEAGKLDFNHVVWG